jgi:hypothetical protein
VGICCADHTTPSLPAKVGINLGDKRRSLGRYSSLAYYGHGVRFYFKGRSAFRNVANIVILIPFTGKMNQFMCLVFSHFNKGKDLNRTIFVSKFRRTFSLSLEASIFECGCTVYKCNF